MRDFLNLGASPSAEDCAQLGDPDYTSKAREECKRYLELIRKTLGDEPEGARLSIKSFPHDFGSYMEVVCYFDDKIPESIDYAYKCESEAPENWGK